MDISDEAIKSILYGSISPLTQTNNLAEEEMLLLVKEKILKCYSLDKKTIRRPYFRLFTKIRDTSSLLSRKDYLDIWNNFLGQKIKPSNDRLFANPDTNGSQNKGCTRKLLKDFHYTRDFYDEIGLTKIVRIIDRDIDNTSKKG
jgi:hypothetical protein